MNGIANDKIAAEIERIRTRAYADQAYFFDAFRDLLDLLDTIHCDHHFESKLSTGDPQNKPEIVVACTKCGFEAEE